MDEAFCLPGPFGAKPILGIAVSGGADSMALALLTRDWVAGHGGATLALIVDHGLRANSAAEAAMVRDRLHDHGVPAVVITLTGVPPGAAAARRMRHAALDAACAERGIVHLLYGHHAGDQAETLQIRVLAGSGAAGFAGMPALAESHAVRRLRPLLGRSPASLRALLVGKGVAWVEDPSNADYRAQRGRLRHLSRGRGVEQLRVVATRAGRRRRDVDDAIGAWLGNHVRIYPEGYAVIAPGAPPAAALAALIQALSGSGYAIAQSAAAAMARRMHDENMGGATLGGIVIRPAGRLGPGWLLAREVALIAPGVAATGGAMWDRRFRLTIAPDQAFATADIGALAADAARFRRHSHLPGLVLSGLPAIRQHGKLVAVPHLRYPDASAADAWRLQFRPARPAACAPWFGSSPEVQFPGGSDPQLERGCTGA